MSRPSKLTDQQWEKIGKRLLAGESTSELAREFGVSKGLISQRFSKRVETVKAAASLLLKTDEAMNNLNVSEQLAARSLADQLRSISMHLGHAANYGAMTSHKLSGIANAKAQLLDESVDVDSDDGLAKLRGIAALTKLSNDSAQIGMDLLKANREAVESISQPEKNTIKTITIIKAEGMAH